MIDSPYVPRVLVNTLSHTQPAQLVCQYPILPSPLPVPAQRFTGVFADRASGRSGVLNPVQAGWKTQSRLQSGAALSVSPRDSGLPASGCGSIIDRPLAQ